MVVDIRRAVSGETSGTREYTCSQCGHVFVGSYSIRHHRSKSADLANSVEAEIQGLEAQWAADARRIHETHHPAVRCPRCGTVPEEVRAYYRPKIARWAGLRGALLGFVVTIVLGYWAASASGARQPIDAMPLWSILGFVPGAMLGFVLAPLLAFRLWPRLDHVLDAPDGHAERMQQ